MSDYERSLIRANDIKAGRTIPPWKFWAMFFVTVVSFTVIKGFADWNIVVGITALVWGAAWFKLIEPYKARSIG